MHVSVNSHSGGCENGAALPLLPPTVKSYEHQVAGHGRVLAFEFESRPIERNVEPEILHSKEERCVYKPIPAPPKHREVEFYQTVFGGARNGDSQKLLTDLQRFLPTFLGVFQHPSSGVRYIKMQDLLHGFARPSIMDIKMGTKIYQPNASAQKRGLEISRYLFREDIGFYVNGMRLWRGNSDKGYYEHYDKSYGKDITPSSMQDKVLPPLIGCVPANHRLRLLRGLIAELEALLAWFESQNLFHFYTSSILIGLECCPDALAQSHEDVPQVIARMVDFPYIWPANGRPDDGYLVGLRNLVRLCKTYEQGLLDF